MSAATVTSSENIPDFCWWQHHHRFCYWYHCSLRSPCIIERKAKFFFPIQVHRPPHSGATVLKVWARYSWGLGWLEPLSGVLEVKNFSKLSSDLICVFHSHWVYGGVSSGYMMYDAAMDWTQKYIFEISCLLGSQILNRFANIQNAALFSQFCFGWGNIVIFIK